MGGTTGTLEHSHFKNPLRQTALYGNHCRIGAKMVEFAGWEMPLYYKGILEEHRLIRHSCGMFDVSHMGQFLISSDAIEKNFQAFSTNTISQEKTGRAIYTLLCNDEGGIVDDVIVLTLDKGTALVVGNAVNRLSDLHLLKHHFGKNVEPLESHGVIALQGKESGRHLRTLFPSLPELTPMRVYPLKDLGLSIATTGYTGEKGVEIFGPNKKILEIWSALLEQGVAPIGLGARDTLRLEMGYPLYGHELSLEMAPEESIAAWTIKNPYFPPPKVGKGRTSYGIVLKERGVPREGMPLFVDGKQVGKVTSGTFSPMLEKGIALVLSQEKLSHLQQVDIEIRGKKTAGEVVSLPFYNRLKE